MLLEKAVGNQLMLNNGGCRAAPFLFVSPKIYKAVLAQLSVFKIEIEGTSKKWWILQDMRHKAVHHVTVYPKHHVGPKWVIGVLKSGRC
jgi:hypothetical protein